MAESDVTILAWGTVADNNNRVKQRVLDLMGKLKEHKDKLFVVGYGGKYGLHPLSPQLRCTKWKMQQVDYDTYVKELNPSALPPGPARTHARTPSQSMGGPGSPSGPRARPG